jgi:hypothetical protein
VKKVRETPRSDRPLRTSKPAFRDKARNIFIGSRKADYSLKWIAAAKCAFLDQAPFSVTYPTIVVQTILDECFARLLQLRIRLLIGDSHEPFRQLSGIL